MSSYCSKPALSIDTAGPGDVLAPLTKRPSGVDVVLFCAAIRNFHRFHYDQDYTRAQGMGDLIVPGFMMGNWCIEAASRGFDEPVHVRRLRFKNLAVAPIGGSYLVNGKVVSIGADEAEHRLINCQFDVLGDDDRLVTTGQVDLVAAEAYRAS